MSAEALPTLQHMPAEPVVITSMRLLNYGPAWFVRARCSEGVVGMVCVTKRMAYLGPMFDQRVAAFLIGKDARNLSELLQNLYLYKTNYKLTGMPFWCCVAAAELSLLDLLGKRAGRPVTDLVARPGTPVKQFVPVYLSLMNRDLTPEQVVEKFEPAIAATGARAVKVKIGGRMSNNADASPGRTEALIPLLRRRLGDDVAIFADANGSYTPEYAIEVGRMLQDHGVGFFEEPCPFECLDQTRHVAENLNIPVAGGEQDNSLHRWREMIETKCVGIVQPDVFYNGGILRTLHVASLAARAGLSVALHNPHRDASAGYGLQVAAVIPNGFTHHEWNIEHINEPWSSMKFAVEGGEVRMPPGPGMGVSFDRLALHAERARYGVRHARRKVESILGRRA
ncbi:MAG: mandelate racemase/muconate lactonizing enzyme family protein [Phycisphaerae bacterium]